MMRGAGRQPQLLAAGIAVVALSAVAPALLAELIKTIGPRTWIA
jgi:hypothetical protein